MLRRSTSWIVPCVVLSVVLHGQDATAPVAQRESYQPIDPCSLLTQNEAEEILGPLSRRPEHGASRDEIVCYYKNTSNERNGLINIRSYPATKEGRATWEEEARRKSNQRMSGLGDEAYAGLQGTYVRRPSLYLRVYVSLNDPDAAAAAEKKLTRTILTRFVDRGASPPNKTRVEPSGPALVLPDGYTAPRARPAPAAQTPQRLLPEPLGGIYSDGSHDVPFGPLWLHVPAPLPFYDGPALPEACVLLAGAGVAAIPGHATSDSDWDVFLGGVNQCIRNGFILDVDAVMRGDLDLWAETMATWKPVSEAVPGIGDEAWLTDSFLYVRAKHVMLTLFAGGDQYTDARIRAQVLKTIGQKVVSQL